MRETTVCDHGHYGFTQVTIRVNGSEVWVTEDINREQQKLTYDQIVDLAIRGGYHRSKKCIFSIIVSYKPGKEYTRNSRSVAPGESCDIEENMIINALVTDNA